MRRISTTQQKKTKLIRIAKARITNNAKASKLQPQGLAINDRAKKLVQNFSIVTIVAVEEFALGLAAAGAAAAEEKHDCTFFP